MLKPSRVRTCILYDLEDGKIVHTHKEITIASGLERADAEIEARVRKFATKPDRDPKKLRVIFIEDTRAKGRHYKVDSATSELVPVDTP